MSYTGGGWIRPKRRWALYLRDDLACVYCRREIAHILLADCFLTLDHLRLKAHSDNGWRDVITACSSCNNLRHTEPWREFAASMPDGPKQVIARVQRQIRRSERKFLTAAAQLLQDRPAWMLYNNSAVRDHFRVGTDEPRYWPDEHRWDDCGAGHTLIDDIFVNSIDPVCGF